MLAIRLKKCSKCLGNMMLYLIMKQTRKSQCYFTILYPRIHRNMVFKMDAFFCYKCETLFRKEAEFFILKRLYKTRAGHKSCQFLGLLV